MMTQLERSLRLAIYRYFVGRGDAPDLGDIADGLGASWASVAKAALRLHDLHAIALGPDRTRSRPRMQVRMAHPFSGVPTAYTVETSDRAYPVNCAWDALALPPLLGKDGICRTMCPISGEPLVIEVRDGEAVDHGGIVHFAVPAKDFWADIGFT